MIARSRCGRIAAVLEVECRSGSGTESRRPDSRSSNLRKRLPALRFHESRVASGSIYESYRPAAFLAIDVPDDGCVAGRDVHGCFEDHEIRPDLGEWVGLAVRDQLEFDYRRIPIC